MKIDDTLYYQSKKLYVARMRFANAFEKGMIGRFIWRCVNLLNGLFK